MLGRDFGPYRILAPLGTGGMGEVFRAHDSKLGRDVALKFLPAHFTSDPERRARFAREARLLATLNHPNIGSIYGLEEANGLSALVLELVEGPTLADRLRQGPMKISEALAVARQIAEALEAAHDKGIVHRDLKPANVVLQSAGALGPSGSDTRAKVLDFGLAKPIVLLGPDAPTVHPAGSFDRTAEGRIVGTPMYMSPEQTRGRGVDKRTDIWAFGASCSRCSPDNGRLKVTRRRTRSRAFWSTSPTGPCCPHNAGRRSQTAQAMSREGSLAAVARHRRCAIGARRRAIAFPGVAGLSAGDERLQSRARPGGASLQLLLRRSSSVRRWQASGCSKRDGRRSQTRSKTPSSAA